MYGCLFHESQEAAFANYRLFESVGFVMAFGYAAALSTASKLYIVLAFLLLGMIGYTLCEVVDRKIYQLAAGNKTNQVQAHSDCHDSSPADSIKEL